MIIAPDKFQNLRLLEWLKKIQLMKELSSKTKAYNGIKEAQSDINITIHLCVSHMVSNVLVILQFNLTLQKMQLWQSFTIFMMLRINQIIQLTCSSFKVYLIRLLFHKIRIKAHQHIAATRLKKIPALLLNLNNKMNNICKLLTSN